MSTRSYFLALIFGILASILLPHMLVGALIDPDNGKALKGTTVIVSPFFKEPIEVSGPTSATISGVASEVSDWKISVNGRDLPVYRHDATTGFSEGVFLLDRVTIDLPATINSTSAVIRLDSDQSMTVERNADYGKVTMAMSVVFAVVFVVLFSFAFLVGKNPNRT